MTKNCQTKFSATERSEWIMNEKNQTGTSLLKVDVLPFFYYSDTLCTCTLVSPGCELYRDPGSTKHARYDGGAKSKRGSIYRKCFFVFQIGRVQNNHKIKSRFSFVRHGCVSSVSHVRDEREKKCRLNAGWDSR